MSVPSVATSVSPTSTSSIFSSQSYSTESTMVTPTQGLVSQQILTVPSSSTIVDMATLNSLNMHSCNGTNLVCRNAHSLPSQESSFPVNPDPCISNVTTSKMTSSNESSAIIQEIFKSSSLAKSCRSIPNSNCKYDTSKQHNPIYSTEICTTGSNTNGVNGKADVHKNFSFARIALSESCPLRSGSTSDSDSGCKLELEHLNACYCSTRMKRVRDPSIKQVVNHSSVIFENEHFPSSLKPPPKLPDAKEDPNDNTFPFHCCNDDIQGAHMPKASQSVCSSCNYNNFFMLSEELKKQSLEGQFNCGILNQKSSYKLLSDQDCSNSNLNESSELEKYPSWGLSSLSDMPFRISCLLPQETKQLHNDYIYSGANILSIPSLLVDEHLHILKFTISMDPPSKISSNGFCEYLSPKFVKNSDLASFNSGKNGLNDSYLCCESRKRWFQEQLVLVLAEVPAFVEQFSLDLSEIIQQVSHENLGLNSKAVFMKKISGISSADSSKNGILSFIKVVSAKKYFNSAEESIADIRFPCDQMFAKIIPAADIIIKLNSSSLYNILPLNEIKPEEEDSLSGLISCLIVPSEKYFAKRELPLPSKDVEKSLYVGLLVPSTKLLQSLNISICQKDSLGVRLGSSRPNQQYSTHTSVDLQLNGNNVEFIPIIPLGMYSQSESSDPDLKFLTPVAESSFRDVHNIEDIFLINNGSREEVLNLGETSQKELGFADIFSSKSSPCDLEAHIKNPKGLKEYHCFSTSDIPESISKGNIYCSLQPNNLLECLGERPKNVCTDSNDIFYTVSMPSVEDIQRKNEKRCTRMPGETTVNIIQLQLDKVSEKNGLGSPCDESFLEVSNSSLKPECYYDDGKSTILVPHLSNAVQPIPEGFLPQECEFSLESSVFSEKLEEVEEGIDSINSENSTNLSSVDFTSVVSQPKNNLSESLCSELQSSKKDLLSVETLNSNCYSMKRKIHNKRSEGCLKPFRVSRMNRNKPSVDLRRAREMHGEEEIVKMRDDVNTKLCSAGKSAANSWKHYRYGSNCFSMIKNIVTSSTHLNSVPSVMEDHSKIGEESSGRSVIHKIKYKADTSASVAPKFGRYGDFSSRGRGRLTSSFKSPDRKFGRNFFLSTSGSAKRSKLTILIFCLAVTSLLISLHALSTDSSLYIKPTFFLVQEEDTDAASFSSESSYLKTSSSDHSENGGLMVASGPIYRSILVKEEIGMVKEEKGVDGSVTYIKSRKDTLNWTRSEVDDSLEMKSRNGILSEMDLKGSSFKMASGRNNIESKQFSGLVKNILNGSGGKNGSILKPSISKAAFYFLNNANFTNLKTNLTSAVGENTEEVSNSIIRKSGHVIQHRIVSGNNVEQHVTSITDSGIESSSSADHIDVGGNVIGEAVGALKASSVKDNRGIVLSSTENLTKLPPNGEGISSNRNDFDLNIAFIEKNELNAAYGIDSGTTGAEGNFEEDYMGEEDMTQMATSGNRVKFPKATRRLPQALIIGVRKGGTRALLEMLHLHPLVQKAAGEAHFFDRDENYAKGLQWYRRRMPPSLKGQITVEKSPSYFVTPEVPERVRAMNASIRLLLIVREPVTRAISDFAQLRSHSLAAKANTTIRTKLDGVDEDYGKKVTRPLSSFESLAILPDGRVDMSWRPISVSLYHRHISAWLEAFPRDQILIVDGDQLASNPAPVLASVEKFLKLRPALTPTHFYFNATKGFYCLRSLPPGQQVDGMAMMPSSLSQSSLPEGKCLRESKGRRHPHVDPSVVHKLRRFFAEHNRRFYEMVGEDFGWPEE